MNIPGFQRAGAFAAVTLLVCGQSSARAATPAPDSPASSMVVARDPQDRPVMRAVHVPGGLTIDGKLDESLYRDVVPLSDFVQAEPNTGEPSTERTDVWIAYDDKN